MSGQINGSAFRNLKVLQIQFFEGVLHDWHDFKLLIVRLRNALAPDGGISSMNVTYLPVTLAHVELSGSKWELTFA